MSGNLYLFLTEAERWNARMAYLALAPEDKRWSTAGAEFDAKYPRIEPPEPRALNTEREAMTHELADIEQCERALADALDALERLDEVADAVREAKLAMKRRLAYHVAHYGDPV